MQEKQGYWEEFKVFAHKKIPVMLSTAPTKSLKITGLFVLKA